jgi:phenylpyruvate tautomerase PptA (4-oxalocrotonate tautomerase family)
MPTYHVEMLEGRTVEQKKKLVQEITVSPLRFWEVRPTLLIF